MNAGARPMLVARRLTRRVAGLRLAVADRSAQGRGAREQPGLDPTPLTPDAVVRYITESLAGTLTLDLPGITYCSLEPARRWPAFAAIETGDGLDGSMRGLAAGAFRVSVVVDHRTFERARDASAGLGRDTPDVLLPHPTYDGLCWVSILNPTVGRFNDAFAPRLAEAYSAMRNRLGIGHARLPRPAGQRERDEPEYLEL